jgi:hypothetical protein
MPINIIIPQATQKGNPYAVRKNMQEPPMAFRIFPNIRRTPKVRTPFGHILFINKILPHANYPA